MTNAIVPANGHADVLEAVVAQGDLSKLTPAQRVEWYKMRCEAAGLDPRTQPFQYITLQGKLTLYATKTATEQLCLRRGLSTEIIGRDKADDLYIVTCRASTADGRHTDSIGAVSILGKKGDDLANALMKAETKAKRRAVLALCGLGMLDETEVETIPERESVTPAPPAVTIDDPVAFRVAVDGLAERVAYYRNDYGAANKRAVMKALTDLGVERVTVDNVASVIAALTAYANEQADKQADKQAN